MTAHLASHRFRIVLLQIVDDHRGAVFCEASCYGSSKPLSCARDECCLSFQTSHLIISSPNISMQRSRSDRRRESRKMSAMGHELKGSIAHAFGGRSTEAVACIDYAVRLSPRDT